MTNFYQAILWLHIIFGTIALILFWITAGAKKGSALHVLSGKYYFIFMWIVVISALVLCIFKITFKQYQGTIYLGFLALLLADPLWYSKAILKEGKILSRSFILIKRTFGALLFVYGLGLIIIAQLDIFKGNMVLFYIFGGIGLLGIFDVFKTKSVEITQNHKLKLHIQGTILSGMAGHTAFIIFGANDLITKSLPENVAIIPWILPILIALVMIKYFSKKFLK